jgi:hypothetical protein
MKKQSFVEYEMKTRTILNKVAEENRITTAVEWPLLYSLLNDLRTNSTNHQ